MRNTRLLTINGNAFSGKLTQKQTDKAALNFRKFKGMYLDDMAMSNIPVGMRPGIDGLKSARRILLDGNSAGLLIGGVCERIWVPGVSERDLAAHKDVDVLLLGGRAVGGFRGGIDWWNVQGYEMEYAKSGRTAKETVTAYSNFDDAVLKFYFSDAGKFIGDGPALYVPSSELVAEIKACEIGCSKEEAKEEIKGRLGDSWGKAGLPSFLAGLAVVLDKIGEIVRIPEERRQAVSDYLLSQWI